MSLGDNLSFFEGVSVPWSVPTASFSSPEGLTGTENNSGDVSCAFSGFLCSAVAGVLRGIIFLFVDTWGDFTVLPRLVMIGF